MCYSSSQVWKARKETFPLCCRLGWHGRIWAPFRDQSTRLQQIAYAQPFSRRRAPGYSLSLLHLAPISLLYEKSRQNSTIHRMPYQVRSSVLARLSVLGTRSRQVSLCSKQTFFKMKINILWPMNKACFYCCNQSKIAIFSWKNLHLCMRILNSHTQ